MLVTHHDMITVEKIIGHKSFQIVEIGHSPSNVQGEFKSLHGINDDIGILVKNIVQRPERHVLTNYDQIWRRITTPNNRKNVGMRENSKS